MKILKITGITLTVLLVLFIATALSYRLIKTQGIIEPFTINEDTYETRILLATQEKSFKNDVIAHVTDHFLGTSVFIQVIDVTDFESVNTEEWDAFVILTTVQSSDIQPDTRNFLENKADYDNVLLLLTADSNTWARKDLDIDAVTSASKNDNIDLFSEKIIAFVENRLN